MPGPYPGEPIGRREVWFEDPNGNSVPASAANPLPVVSTPTATPGGTGVQRVSAGFMAAGQTAKQYVGRQSTSTTAATTVTLETVASGKTFYITDINMFTDLATPIDGSIQAGGTPIFYFGVSTTAPVDACGMETQPYATTGQVVTLNLPQTTAVQKVWYNIYGFEQ